MIKLTSFDTRLQNERYIVEPIRNLWVINKKLSVGMPYN